MTLTKKNTYSALNSVDSVHVDTQASRAERTLAVNAFVSFKSTFGLENHPPPEQTHDFKNNPLVVQFPPLSPMLFNKLALALLSLITVAAALLSPPSANADKRSADGTLANSDEGVLGALADDLGGDILDGGVLDGDVLDSGL